MANLKLIEAKTVGSGGTASITFTSIPQTYTDLKLVVSGRSSTTTTGIDITFNGTTSGYSNKRLYGTGSGTPASDSAATTYISNTMINDSSYTASVFGNGEIYIPNYTSSNYKSVSVDGVSENNDTTALMMLTAGLWSNTAAITSITLAPNAGPGSGLFTQYSTFYLYGISNVTTGSKATGGIVSYDSTYYYHMFPYSGTFTPTQSLTASVLVIAGGGGGGSDQTAGTWAAGGGAGGIIYNSSVNISSAATITVGSGGSGASSTGNGSAGSNSTFVGASTMTAVGGGYGAGGGGGGNTAGGSGGSGGGGIGSGSGGSTTQNSTNGTGYGSAGGTKSGNGGAGGGGAGGSGGAVNGGAGLSTWSSWAIATQTGVNGYYAGGGGGRDADSPYVYGVGGLGGGGGYLVTGVTNTGSGGGGGGGGGGYAGGSGLVIIRYAI